MVGKEKKKKKETGSTRQETTIRQKRKKHGALKWGQTKYLFSGLAVAVKLLKTVAQM